MSEIPWKRSPKMPVAALAVALVPGSCAHANTTELTFVQASRAGGALEVVTPRERYRLEVGHAIHIDLYDARDQSWKAQSWKAQSWKPLQTEVAGGRVLSYVRREQLQR